MDKSRRSGWRGAIGALAMLAIVSGLLVGTATVAEAKQINSVSQLEKSCSKGTGKFTPGAGGQSGICDVKGGYVVCMNPPPKGRPVCQGVRNAARSLVPADDVPGAHGVVMTTQEVSGSHLWKQELSIPVLTDAVCPSLGGQVVASADATVAACGAPTATIICAETPGTNCLGIAGTEKQADSIPKQIKTTVGNAGSTQTTPTTTPTPTTSSNAPPTTRKCLNSRRCPPPTLPPAKAPGQSVPVGPQQNR